ncbi:MAG: hypothetical protein HZA78_01835 [Candidatus Schekmanbacteria bacterium]|nr:hypothetical protein [Candidatus Schekmanbacteria bacterium]
MDEIISLHKKAEAALKEAVRGVVERHKETGHPLVVWRDGKVVYLYPTAVNISARRKHPRRVSLKKIHYEIPLTSVHYEGRGRICSPCKGRKKV